MKSLPLQPQRLMTESQADALASAMLAEIDHLKQRLDRLASIVVQLQLQLRAQEQYHAEDSTAGKPARSLQI